jgi:lipopolysaccharide transport system permease protein
VAASIQEPPQAAPKSGSRARVHVIEPPKRFGFVDLAELWAYRELLIVLCLRDIKVRYKQTVLGVAWAIIQPLMNMVVFSIIFGKVAKLPSDGYPYPIFLFAALLPWSFFSNSITASSNSLVGSANLISKVYFPRLIIPLSSIGTCTFDFAISALLLLVLMPLYGVPVTLELLLTPLLALGIALAALGVGIILAALNVVYRDFRYVVPFAVQLWMYATPVVYPARLVPEKWRLLYALNPVAGLIEAFRAAVLGTRIDLGAALLSLSVAVVLFVVGILYFERTERNFADVV